MTEEKNRPIDVDRVGDFVVEGVLGQGGMGMVYAARAPDGTPAAVKVMRVGEEEQEAYLGRFEREAQMRVDHPNVVRLLGAGLHDDGSPYIAFEQLEGEGLDRRMRRTRLGLPAIREVAIQICRGLGAVHAAGIVHRDLKPGNVFLCKDGAVKLIDFGIARWTEVETDLTQGAIVGTPSYLSPEQARGQATVDGRADLWALGVILYEALTGQRPFRRDSPLTTMMAVVMDDPVPIQTIVKNLPPALTALIHRCLEKSRSDRPQTADEVREVLEALDLRDVGSLEIALDVEVDALDLTGASDQTRAEETRASLTTIAPDEQRLLAVVLALGVDDPQTFDDAVVGRGGTVIQFLGRQAIGVFGLTEWEGDEVERATRAALDARSACEAVSVATGRAFQRGRGVAGAALDRAELGARARLEGVAVLAETARALGPGFVVKEARGGLVEVVGETDEGAATMASVSAILHGRQAELDGLLSSLQEAVDAPGAGAVVLVGPLGIGKTRLSLAFADRAREAVPGIRVLTGRADPRRRDVGLQLVSSVLQSRARHGILTRRWPDISAEATIDRRREGVDALVREAVQDDVLARECADFLGELLGVPMPESPGLAAARQDPQLMADRLRLALVDYFVAMAQQGPLAILLEDFQWADAPSVELLEELLEALAFEPFFLLVTGRSELDDRYPGLFADRGAARVALGPLRPAPSMALANEVAGRPLPRELLEPIVKRADGNPLFITEIVRALAAEGAPSGETQIPLPLTVEAAVQARLDQISDEERAVIKRASIFQRAVTEGDLAAVGLRDPARELAGLARRGVLAGRQRAGGGGREYAFRSTLLAEVAYQSMSPEYRSELHRRVAEHLEGAMEPDPEELAFHWESAGETARAAGRYVEATLAAERRGDAGEVLRCSARAIELGLPDAHAFALHMARADALRFAGERAAQHAALDLAVEHAADELERARALTELGHCAFRLGLGADAFVAAEEAVRAARRAGDPSVLALALGRAATLHVFSGKLVEAEERLEEARRLAAHGALPVRASLAEWEGLLANASGDVGRQMRAFTEAAALYDEVGDVRRAAGAANNVADAHNRLGDFASAEVALRETVAKCRRLGNRAVEGYALANLGYALVELGRLEEATASLDEAATRAQTGDDKRLDLFVELYRARCALAAAPTKIDAVRAAARADDAATEADRLSMTGARMLALALAARAMLLAGLNADALERTTAAMALRDEIGGVSEDEAEVFLTHAKALAANGRIDEAREVLTRARERVQEVAHKIGDLALRARFLADVPAHRELIVAGDDPSALT